MSFKGAIRWGLRPKRIGILLAKLVLAGTTELAAQTSSYQGACGETLIVPAQQDQRPLAGKLRQPPTPSPVGEMSTRLR